VRNASSGGIVLRYRYTQGLRAEPGALPVRPFTSATQSGPFVEVQNGDLADFDLVFDP
jgi:hypothetical protein